MLVPPHMRFAHAALASTLVLACAAPAVAVAGDPGDDARFLTRALRQWDEGFALTSDDDRHEVRFTGRVMVDVLAIDGERDVERALGERIHDDLDDTSVRVTVRGHLFHHFIFKGDLELADASEDVEARDAYVGLRDVPFLGRLRFGNIREPLSLDAMTSRRHLVFVERALPTALTPGRNVGLEVRQVLLEDRMTAWLGAYRDANGKVELRGNDAWSLTARLTGVLYAADGDRRLVHVGAGYSHRFTGAGGSRWPFGGFDARPEVRLAPSFVDTGSIEADGMDVVGGELAVVLGPFSAQTELLWAFVDAADAGNPQLAGWYAQASWFLTGEHRRYNRSKGSFKGVKPNRSFLPVAGDCDVGPGAWEVGVRFSHLRLDDAREGAEGGELNDLTLGLNWHLAPKLRLAGNYVLANLAGEGAAHIWQARLTVEW